VSAAADFGVFLAIGFSVLVNVDMGFSVFYNFHCLWDFIQAWNLEDDVTFGAFYSFVGGLFV